MATTLQFPTEITIDRPAEVASSKAMARLFFACFWTIVFTGAIRKWVFPGSSVFYLLQDVPITLAYLYAIWSRNFSRGLLTLAILLLSAIVGMQGLLQVMGPEINTLVAAVGLHHYLYYIPMLIVFPLSLTEKHRKNFIYWNLMLSIPMCLLALAQSIAPKSSFVNRSSEGEGFGVAGAEVARVMGTFNFTLFYGIWVATAVALCLGEWLLPKERRAIRSTWILILCTFTVNLCHLVSASRTAIAQAGMAFFGAMIAAVVLRSTRALLTIGGVCVLLPILLFAAYVIAPASFGIVLDRFTGEQYQQNNHDRIINSFISFAIEPPFSLIGAGIGMGIDAAHIGSTDAYNFTYNFSENDLSRNVMELGTPVGLLYVLTRIFFAFGMIFLAYRLVKAGSSPHVLPLAIFLLSQIYTNDMTRNATMTFTQVMVGYAFILGVYYHPDKTSVTSGAGYLTMRSV